MREPPQKLDYGTDDKPASHRAGRLAAFGSALLALAAGVMLLSIVSIVVSLLATAGIVAGIILVVRSVIEPAYSLWYGIIGGALIVACGAVLLLLHHYDLDA